MPLFEGLFSYSIIITRGHIKQHNFPK